MRHVNIDDLTDRTPAEIITTLQDAGYSMLPFETRGTLFHYAHPDAPDEMLRLTFMDDAADTLAAIGAAHQGNPYLPVIHEQHNLRGNPAMALVVMERLYHADEIPADMASVLRGIARAVALLPVGEINHAQAHRQMLTNPHMRSAAQAFARAATASVDENTSAALHYETGMDDRPNINDRFTDNVLFRRDGRQWCPVFADPLRAVTVRDNNHRESLRRDCAAMRAHLGL
jgi:hypothetical protein